MLTCACERYQCPGRISNTSKRFGVSGYERCEDITRRFAERVLDGRRDLRSLCDLPQDLLIVRVALGSYSVERFFFAKSFIASRACDGCGTCLFLFNVAVAFLVSHALPILTRQEHGRTAT